jgi:hypothetical protein
MTKRRAGLQVVNRQPCIVPGCRRSTPAGKYAEWVCPAHWRRVPKAERDEFEKAQKAIRKAASESPEALEAAKVAAVRAWVAIRPRVLECALPRRASPVKTGGTDGL